MTAVLIQIADEIATRLAALGTYQVEAWDRDRDPAQDELPAIVIDLDTTPESQLVTGARQFTSSIDVSLIVAAPGIKAAVSSGLSAIVAAIENPDNTLSGLATDVRLASFDVAILRDEGRKVIAAVTMTFDVDYWTAEQSLETLAP